MGKWRELLLEAAIDAVPDGLCELLASAVFRVAVIVLTAITPIAARFAALHGLLARVGFHGLLVGLFGFLAH
jgi:hypothetical protein